MLNNQRGIAVFEVVPILVIFVLLLNFSMGFFGIIHSGIINSIAARNYAFETFRNRANLNYLRDVPANKEVFYAGVGYRFHGIINEKRPRPNSWIATKRSLRFSDGEVGQSSDQSIHNTKILSIANNSKASDVIPEDSFESVWIRTVYGICLNNQCGSP